MTAIRTALALGAVAASHVAHAECPAPTTTTDLMTALEAAERAYGDLDIDGFRGAMAQGEADLPCLKDPLTRHLAADLHRFEGLLAFLDRDPGRSTRAFAAARSIEPNYRFPESVVPSGNPVLDDYEALDPDASVLQPLGEPISGRLQIDGRDATERAEDYPAVVQLTDASGRVTTTAYLWPDDPMPAYAAKPIATAVPMPGTGTGTSGGRGGESVIQIVDRGPNVPLLVGAGAGLLASGLIYGAAFAIHGQYDDPETSFEDLNRLRSTNNGLVVVSGALAAASVGVGTSAFFVARW